MMDNRSTAVGIVIGVLLAVFLIGGGYLASRLFYTAVDHEVQKQTQQQVQQAVAPAAQSPVRQAVDDAGRKAAKEVSDKLLADARKPETHEDAKSTLEVSEEAPVTVERDAFSITLPPGSTVDPANPDVGSEKLVHARMPRHGSLSIAVIDDKSEAKDRADAAVNEMRGKVDHPKEVAAQVMGLEYWSTAFAATVEDEPYIFEVGQRDGRDKACIFILGYPMMPTDRRKKAVGYLREALQTFRMKQ
jgi:hypothetical protein